MSATQSATPKQEGWLGIFGLYLAYFADTFAIGIVLLIFSPLLIENQGKMLDPATSLDLRNIIFGVAVSLYPLMQLIGNPLLGELSDQYGRRRVLLFSTFITGVSNLISALAIFLQSLTLLLLSRALAGLFSGNMTLAQASVADLTSPQLRGRYMAIFTIAGGLSWILGPLAGRLLSDNNLVAWFGLDLPFWGCALLFFICTLLIFLTYRESYSPKERGIHLKRTFHNLFIPFRIPLLRSPLFFLQTSFIGWSLLVFFQSAYLTEHYHFSETATALSFGVNAASWCISGLLTSAWILKRWTSEKAVRPSVWIVALSLALIALIDKPISFWVLDAITPFFMSLVYTCSFTTLSRIAPPNIQGALMGTANGMISFSFFLAPILAGPLSDLWISLPIFLGSILVFCAAFIHFFWYRRHHDQLPS